jgi:acyl-[acyl-carrier-protein]-phospholipid O-acyltransferase/long-chain-fatty-acid--[acyl-carrier-protein] ligase
VALPDPRKGERIVLVTTQPGLTARRCWRPGRAAHAAELMFPAEVIVVEHLPLLGTGKTDYVGATALAKELAAAPVVQAEEQPAEPEPLAQHVA